MACEIGPVVPQPELPDPLTVTPPALPSLPLNGNLCCKQVGYTIQPSLPPFPPGVSAAMGSVLKPIMASLRTYFLAIPLPCPKE